MSTNQRDQNKVSAPSRPDFVRGMVASYENSKASRGSLLLSLAAGFLIGRAIRRGRE